MQTTHVFDNNAVEYDSWYDKYPFVFQSEVEALRAAMPEGKSIGIEVGLGTGRFCQALGIKEGVEPSFSMRRMAFKRGVEVVDAVAERLPYKDLRFDFVLMITCISYFRQLQPAFKEAYRVLKRGGIFIVAYIEKDSIIGKRYEARRHTSTFYKHAVFYSTEKVTEEIIKAGFKNLEYSQTLFHDLDDINEIEPAQPGFDKGSFVIIKAHKKN